MAVCAVAPVQAVVVEGTSGNGELQVVTVSRRRYMTIAVPVRLEGGAGADEIGADVGPTTLIGGSGNGRITRRCGPGAATLQGGAGNHAVSACAPNKRRKVMVGAAGDDAFSTVTDDGTRATGRSRLVGGAGDDSFLIRNRRRDRATGGAGRDSAFADQSDVLRSIEDVLTRSPGIPGLPRL